MTVIYVLTVLYNILVSGCECINIYTFTQIFCAKKPTKTCFNSPFLSSKADIHRIIPHLREVFLKEKL